MRGRGRLCERRRGRRRGAREGGLLLLCRLANRFPNIVANEPVERGKGRGIHRRLEMRLDGSEGLGPAVTRLLDEEWFVGPSRCARCQHVHIIRLRLHLNELVVVEACTILQISSNTILRWVDTTSGIPKPTPKGTSHGARCLQGAAW
jgi:hypothetical protein